MFTMVNGIVTSTVQPAHTDERNDHVSALQRGLILFQSRVDDEAGLCTDVDSLGIMYALCLRERWKHVHWLQASMKHCRSSHCIALAQAHAQDDEAGLCCFVRATNVGRTRKEIRMAFLYMWIACSSSRLFPYIWTSIECEIQSAGKSPGVQQRRQLDSITSHVNDTRRNPGDYLLDITRAYSQSAQSFSYILDTAAAHEWTFSNTSCRLELINARVYTPGEARDRQRAANSIFLQHPHFQTRNRRQRPHQMQSQSATNNEPGQNSCCIQKATELAQSLAQQTLCSIARASRPGSNTRSSTAHQYRCASSGSEPSGRRQRVD